MTEEAIVADEQKDVDVQDDSTEENQDNDVDVEAIQAEAAKIKEEAEKAKAEAEKREARYKSTMKKNAQNKKEETKEEWKDVDLDSLVEKKLMAIEEQREFVKSHWEDVYKEIQKIKEKHPTLSLEDAYKISPIAKSDAETQDPSTLKMWGRASAKVINDSKTISLEQYVALPQDQYRKMKDRIAKGEVTLKK